MNNEKITVSVVMITYMQEIYIQEAINGVLCQQCNFEIELIVADDNSPDETQSVINELLFRHPNSDWVQYTRHSFNKGIMKNFIWALKKAKGKYIALCDGDDYWTDPLKLQKQVDFLENNKDYSICFHNVQIYDQFSTSFMNDYIIRDVPETTTIDDLAYGNYIHTPSVVFQNNNIEFPNSFVMASAGDYFLHMLNAQFGSIKKISDNMAVYRVHKGGVWSQQIDLRQNICQYLTLMINLFNGKTRQILTSRLVEIKFSLFLSSGKTDLKLLQDLIELDPNFTKEKIMQFKNLNQYSFKELIFELKSRIIRKLRS